MKTAISGTLVAVGLWVLCQGFGERSSVYAERVNADPIPTEQGLIALSAPLGERGGQQITLIDPQARVIGVYHVDSTGTISLKSVRKVLWDLQISELNATDPLPREVRELVEPN